MIVGHEEDEAMLDPCRCQQSTVPLHESDENPIAAAMIDVPVQVTRDIRLQSCLGPERLLPLLEDHSELHNFRLAPFVRDCFASSYP